MKKNNIMDEILFRGKRKDDGQWIFGDLLHSKTGNLYAIAENYVLGSLYTLVHAESIGQYSTFDDIKGKKIFKGDIIRQAYEGDYPSYVIIDFKDGMFGYRSIFPEYTYFLPITKYEIKDYNREVVGNIYDDLELLTKLKTEENSHE